MNRSYIKDIHKTVGFNIQSYTPSLISPVLRLGVTGLSKSGKTVFITALVHNLINNNRLPFFEAKVQGRITKAYLEPQPDKILPRFAYEQHLKKLISDPPEWPESTSRISQLRITIEYQPAGFIKSRLGTAKLHIDLVDYPGEWLLDLPLLNLTYQEWSEQTLDLAKKTERLPVSQDWLNLIKSQNPQAEQDEILAQQLSEKFKTYLIDCRQSKYAFSTTPPGRFVMPGDDIEGSPALTFCPMMLPKAEKPKHNSLWAMMEKNFNAYKKYVIKPFFRDHFIRLDRQIILVDVLSALNRGTAAVKDMEQALTHILQCFKPGKRSWLNTIWGRPIERVIFAATKADHLHHTNHDKLAAIMEYLISEAIERAKYSGADVKTLALASVRATEEAEVSRNGDALPSIVGKPIKGQSVFNKLLQSQKKLTIFPGDLPDDPKEAVEILPEQEKPFNFVNFQPPENILEEHNQVRLPHIRLDRAMEFLFGDKLK